MNDSLSNSTDYDIDLSIAIPVGALLTFIILVTAIGNSLVVAAVIKERNLHTLANRLVASLAVTDLLVGLLVMPFSAAYLIKGSWQFGDLMCDIFITFDVVLCTNSILHLVGIAVDRYWTVTDITYLRGNKKHRYFFPIMVVSSWCLSAAVCLPPFFGWQKLREDVDSDCIISQNFGYTIYSTLSAFYIPLLVIIIIYSKIFLVVRSRVRKRSFEQKYRPPPATSVKETKNVQSDESSSSSIEVKQLNHNSDTVSTVSDPAQIQNLERRDAMEKEALLSQHQEQMPQVQKKDILIKENGQHKVLKPARKSPCYSTSRREKIAHKRERKALFVLIIITGIFATCWLPFFIFQVLHPVCGKLCEDMPKWVGDFVTWLGYFNSMLNPFIYTIFSPDFRAAFKKILCDRKR